jgi:signal transduction histidine kinase
MRASYDSLRFRLLAVAAVSAIVGLVSAYLIITGVFREHLAGQFRRDLEVHLAELSSIARVGPDGRPGLAQPLPDPRFQAFGSHYWQVDRDGEASARSPSLGEHRLAGDFATGPEPRNGTAQGPKGPVLEYGRTIAAPDGGPPLRLSIASDVSVLTSLINSSQQMLVIALVALGAILVTGAAVQLVYGLRPLDRLGRAIAEMRKNGRSPDERTFPSEVRPLLHDLGAVLQANAQMVQRARVEAGSLAHGLRTPLAIVMDEAEQLERRGQAEAARSLLDQCLRMQKQIDYHLARARAVGAPRTPGTTVTVAGALAPILSAMVRLHGPRGVVFEAGGDDTLALAVDPEDFAEIVSALLDNAGKWAASQVRVGWARDGDHGNIWIDDDGRGLPAVERERVFAIGERLDDTVAGSGLGLAIARDVAILYGGSVSLRSAPEFGGLRAFVSLPLHSASR